ncbi:hypothetical protein AB6A40_008904 [Gnathostoma spinigerum]|uniref:MORN repeat-containing protein n=1 Tax=Gnathostoma spinigerum TaxID=75299 RepID=A0ABD6ERL9_9BILA
MPEEWIGCEWFDYNSALQNRSCVKNEETVKIVRLDERSSGLVYSEWSHRLCQMEVEFDRTTTLAEDTFEYWNCASELFGKEILKRPNRLVLWKANVTDRNCVVTSVNNLTSKSYLPGGWLSLVVCNDVVALIERRECVILEFPLVWTDNVQKDDRHIIRLYGAETEIHIEFNDATPKTDFIHACQFWSHKKRYFIRQELSSGNCHRIRTGSYKFSQYHAEYKNCVYDGRWRLGRPHGFGVLTYPDGKKFKGYFNNGVIEGFGELSVPVAKPGSFLSTTIFYYDLPEASNDPTIYDVYTGCWSNGKISGLSSVRWADGSTYEGFMKNGLRQGYGVKKWTADGQRYIYVGGWKNGMRNGYGVLSSNKERYLGMWNNDVKHGVGSVITIDGSFHEGTFEKGRLVGNGQLLLQHLLLTRCSHFWRCLSNVTNPDLYFND